MLNKIKYPIRTTMLILFIMMMINIYAENPSSANYILQQNTIGVGSDLANPPVSANYILTSSTIDVISCEEAISENYIILPGYYHGVMLEGILAPENVTIAIVGTNVQLSWDPVSNSTYKVFSSDDPLTGFMEDTSGSFSGASWITTVPSTKKFYYVKTVK